TARHGASARHDRRDCRPDQIRLGRCRPAAARAEPELPDPNRIPLKRYGVAPAALPLPERLSGAQGRAPAPVKPARITAAARLRGRPATRALPCGSRGRGAALLLAPGDERFELL